MKQPSSKSKKGGDRKSSEYKRAANKAADASGGGTIRTFFAKEGAEDGHLYSHSVRAVEKKLREAKAGTAACVQ